MNAESSNPTTETSPGTDRPARRTARIAPSASTSLAQMTPVTPCRSSRVVAAWPPSRENSACSTGASRRRGRDGGVLGERGELAARRHVVGRTGDQADPLVAERGQVGIGLPGRGHVVGGHAREVQPVDRRVEQHRRNAPRTQQPVVVVRGALLGVVTAGEHHPGDVLVEQHADVVGLRQAARRAGAQHRREAPLRQRPADHLGQRREDRVLQFGQHQADEPGAFTAQLGGPFVAEDVERGQHGLPGTGGHAGLAVEDPADRGLADPHLLGHLREPPAGYTRHGCKYTASIRKYLQNLTHRIRQFSAERTSVLAAAFRKSNAMNVA